MLFFFSMMCSVLVLVFIVFLSSFLMIDVGCLMILLVVIWLISWLGRGWIVCSGCGVGVGVVFVVVLVILDMVEL